jgi:parallel beta-helix repeat protein
MKRVKIVALLTAFLMLQSIGMLAQSPDALVQEEYQATPIIAATYTPHGPMNISSNADFAARGWNGTGTQADPYSISGLSFDAKNPIRIANTTAYFSITDCMFSYSADMGETAISLTNTTSGDIESCIFQRYSAAIAALEGNGTHISSNTMHDCQTSVALGLCYRMEVLSNTIENTTQGLSLWSVIDSLISSNTIYGGQWTGISMWDNGTGTVISNNEVYNINNLFILEGAIDVEGFGWTVVGNTIHDSGIAVTRQFMWPGNNEFNITHNSIYNCVLAISLYGAYNGTIEGNLIDSCRTAITLTACVRADIMQNTISNAFSGLIITTCRECRIVGNQLQNASFSVIGYAPSEYRNVVQGNTIDGRDIGYFLDETDTTITSPTYEQIYLVNCTDVEIQNQNITGANVGFTMAYSSSCGIVDSTISKSLTSGIYLYYTQGCYVRDSTVTQNGRSSYGDGIYMLYSNNTEIARNLIYNNAGNGIRAHSSIYSAIHGNLITNNTKYGISFDSKSSHNEVYGNEIGWNGAQNAWDDGMSDSWDDGNSLGNWWSDYSSTGSNNYTVYGNADSHDNFPSEYRSWSLSLPPISTPSDFEVIVLSVIGVCIILAAILALLRRKRML